ncbi:MAG: VWA domain-containing protein [Bdellovibrionaceae bacterium]|nr:VWA domain-containing protein [Pseudobdellovibrionaceae bacterium]
MSLWLSPWAFLFLLPFVAFLGWLLWSGGPKRGYVRFGAIYFKELATTWRVRLKYFPDVLKIMTCVFAVLALARPQKADEKVKRNIEGIDIMVTLDVSESMLIEDMKPINRLESSKKTIEDFIKKRVSDRIGAVVFSGEAYTRVPLTLDYQLLLDNVAKIKTSRNIKMGTAIGVALANACARLKDSDAKSKVIILLTDGENNTGLIDPLTALRIAKGYGIKIYTIGAGKDGDAQLPVYTPDIFGRMQKRYQPIHSSVNVELLTQMAEETGGKFFRATDTKTLESVFSEIDRLEKTKIDVDRFVKYKELFQEPLWWAVLLYVLAGVLQLTVLRRGI